MLAQFFIRRPVFAWVIAICIMMFGVLSIKSLPIAQYPDVAPPQISIQATYTGASAETLESSVTQVIEQQLPSPARIVASAAAQVPQPLVGGAPPSFREIRSGRAAAAARVPVERVTIPLVETEGHQAPAQAVLPGMDQLKERVRQRMTARMSRTGAANPA